MLFELLTKIDITTTFLKSLLTEKKEEKTKINEEIRILNCDDIETGYYYKNFPNLPNKMIEILDLELGYGLNYYPQLILNLNFKSNENENENNKIYPIIDLEDFILEEEKEFAGELHQPLIINMEQINA
jgi:hypothetical protein